MAKLRISEAEAVRDFAAVIARVREGAEILIEDGARPIAVISPPRNAPGILLSQMIARAEVRNSALMADEGFSRDVRAAIDSHREPFSSSEWD